MVFTNKTDFEAKVVVFKNNDIDMNEPLEKHSVGANNELELPLAKKSKFKLIATLSAAEMLVENVGSESRITISQVSPAVPE